MPIPVKYIDSYKKLQPTISDGDLFLIVSDSKTYNVTGEVLINYIKNHPEVDALYINEQEFIAFKKTIDKIDNTADAEKIVLSATRLTTGSKMNGTLFDGTKDITTEKWGTKRLLNLTGDISGSVSTDGGSDINIEVTVVDDSHNHTAATLPSASSSVKGVTNLINSVTNTSNNAAATPNSVKTAYDKIIEVNNSLNDSIEAESTRAQESETSIAGKLNIEIARATNTEDTISATLSEEIIRANNAEKVNSDSITAEIQRSITAENKIANNLSTEITRAKSAEDSMQKNIDTNKPIWDDKYTKNEVDNKFSSLETATDWKEAVNSYADLATKYPKPEDGWTVNVKDTDYTYRWSGTEWVAISANAIPKSTQSVDGLLSKEDKTAYDDANIKKHVHSNKTVLDSITSALITAWNNAVTHISDGIKHITSSERTLWNTVSDKVDKVSGKELSSNDFTTELMTKLNGITQGANKYTHPTTDGNKHVPANGTSNNGKLLKASAIAGSYAWGNLTFSDVTDALGYTPGSSSALILGETASTAYRGDRGKTAYDHSQSAHAPGTAEKNVIVGIQKNGADLVIGTDRKANITIPTKVSELTNDSGFITTDNNTTYKLTKSGSTVTLTGSDGSNNTVVDSNTTYATATTTTNGLMSSTDKAKLDGVAANANNYTHPNSGATASTYRSVTVNTQGHVTAGTNPTTLAGYGITDAAKSTHNHTSAEIGALSTAGGTMTDSISSSLTTSTHIAGNQGRAIINSTAGAGSYTMLAKMNSNNGVFAHGSYTTGYRLYYTANSVVNSGINAVTKEALLLDESGNSVFPGTVYAPYFSGTLTGNATQAIHDSSGRQITTTYATKSELGNQVTYSLSGTTLRITSK